MKIALLQNHKSHYYRIQHLINTLKLTNDVCEIKNISEITNNAFDVLLIEYFSSHTSNPHEEMISRMKLLKPELMRFKGHLIFYSVDDGQALYIRDLDLDIVHRIDAWFVYMKSYGFINDDIERGSIIEKKLVLIPRYTLPYINSENISYEKKQNKIVFIGRTTGNYWFENGKNWRVECLRRIWDNKFLREKFDGWLVDDNIIDVPFQNEEYKKSFKFIKKDVYISEETWYEKLRNNTLSLCMPGHTKYGYRHSQSMKFKTTMLSNFNMELDPYPWLFSDKLTNISYTVNSDLSNFEELCIESLINREKTENYANIAYDIYKFYFEPTANNEFQSHIWKIVTNQLQELNINDI